MKVYADPITVNCRKVLAGLDLIGAGFELVHVDYFKGEHRLDAYKQLNPNASLPALVDSDLTLWKSSAINVWKSLAEPVEELPLAMCDADSDDDGDMLTMELRYRERTGEIYVMRYSASHRWTYFPGMTAREALLFKTFDSKVDGSARFVGHTAFEDPTSPPDARKRESVEVRTMAFF